MKSITMASLSLLLAVCATSASASYFFNSRWGTMLNVGSAPNPTPEQLRAIGDSRYIAARGEQPPSRAVPLRPEPQIATLPFAPVGAEVVPAIPIVVTKVSVRQERRVTAELNRASLTYAKAIASTASAAKAKVAATKAVSRNKVAAKALGTKRTAGNLAAPVKTARVKGKPPVKTAAGVANRQG